MRCGFHALLVLPKVARVKGLMFVVLEQVLEAIEFGATNPSFMKNHQTPLKARAMNCPMGPPMSQLKTSKRALPASGHV